MAVNEGSDSRGRVLDLLGLFGDCEVLHQVCEDLVALGILSF